MCLLSTAKCKTAINCLGANETKKRPGTPEAVPGACLSCGVCRRFINISTSTSFKICQTHSDIFHHIAHITHIHDFLQNGLGVRDTLFLVFPFQVRSYKLLRSLSVQGRKHMDIQTDTCAMTCHAQKWRRWRGQSMSKSSVLSIASNFQLMSDRTRVRTMPGYVRYTFAHRFWHSQVFGETDRSHCRVWGWYSWSFGKNWRRAMPRGRAARARSDTEFPIAIL